MIIIISYTKKEIKIYVDKHKPSDEMIKDLDNLLSKLNAMEIVAADEYQKNSVKNYESISRRGKCIQLMNFNI